MRGKSGKRRFSTRKSQWGGGRGKQTKRWRPPALLLSIHKQHKPALAGEPIKSSQANAGGGKKKKNGRCLGSLPFYSPPASIGLRTFGGPSANAGGRTRLARSAQADGDNPSHTLVLANGRRQGMGAPIPPGLPCSPHACRESFFAPLFAGHCTWHGGIRVHYTPKKLRSANCRLFFFPAATATAMLKRTSHLFSLPSPLPAGNGRENGG